MEHTVLIVGVGALGSAVAPLLVEEAVLVLCDYDIVQEDNLDRCPLYTREDVGVPKVEAAKARLEELSENAQIEVRREMFSADTPLDGISVIVDGTDNLESRFLLNDAAKQRGIPLVIGTAAGSRGICFTVGKACWQCIAEGKHATDDCSTGIEPATVRAVAEVQTRMVRAALERSPEEGLVLVGEKEVRIAARRNPSCAACRGEYTYLTAPFSLRFCEGTKKIHARPSAPRKVSTASLEVIEEFGSAVRVKVGNGTALVHQHGLIEFEHVSQEEARAFASTIIK